jgi:hypothetical protein
MDIQHQEHRGRLREVVDQFVADADLQCWSFRLSGRIVPAGTA